MANYVFEDYETEGVGPRPERYPPKPVGVAIKNEGSDPVYFAWGHPVENNCRRAAPEKLLRQLHKSYEPVYHNAAFDIEVGQRWLNLPIPKKFHDTVVLAFLHNPHEANYHLKSLAPRYCGVSTDARDELQEWIIANVPAAKKKKKEWGAYISLAPAELVGRYAKMDVVMTEQLFKFLHHKVCAEMGMQEAYDREMELIPHIIKLENRGVEVDVPALDKLIPVLEKNLSLVDKKIRLRLKAPGLDLDKKGELAKALQAANKVADWPLTKKGLDLQEAGMLDNREKYHSTSHKLLKKALNDRFLWHLLFVRGKLATSLRTNARPWRDYNHHGKIYIKWSCTRKDDSESAGGGARTGRLSSSPNLQNIPSGPKLKQFEAVATDTKAVKKEKEELYKLYLLVPNMRQYIIPGKGNVFCIRDYSQQEMRLLAHFEDGPLLQAYMENPKLDIHAHAADLIYQSTSLDMRSKEMRTPVKVINFGRIYGMGKDKLADTADITPELAGKLMRAHKLAFPGVTALDNDLKAIGMDGGAIKTLGGRKYFAEEPRFVIKNKVTGAGRWWRFEYKLLNYLIQGSAADMLKMAMLKLFRAGLDIVLTVHDEIVVCCAEKDGPKTMKKLEQIMGAIKLDLPLYSDGEIVSKSWGEMKK